MRAVDDSGNLGYWSNTINVQVNMGIDNQSSDDNIEIEPNPATDFVSITCLSETHISIYNLIGEEIMSKIISKGTTKINLAEFTSGCYLIKVADENGITTRKLVVK